MFLRKLGVYLALALVFVFSYTADAVRAAEIKVPADQPTIQAAINAAVNNDTIIVADGTYTGTGNKNLDFGGKTIVVRSENGPANCIIDCEDSGRGFYFHSSETSSAIVDGFTITNGNGDNYMGGAIYFINGIPTIKNCILTNNSTNYGGGGVALMGTASPKFINCLITNNTAYSFGGGVYCYATNATPTFVNCTIADNHGSFGGGIFNAWSNPTLTNCIIWGNTDNIHIADQIRNQAGTFTLNNCCYADGWGNVYGTVIANNCITTNPLFVGNGDYHLQYDSPCVDAGDNSYVPQGVTTDLDGNDRITDGDGDDTATVDIGPYEYAGQVVTVEFSPDVAVYNPTILICNMPPGTPQGGQFTYTVISEPSPGTGMFYLLVPSQTGVEVYEENDLRIADPVGAGIVALRPHAIGNFTLHVQYEVGGQVWNSEDFVITAHDVVSVSVESANPEHQEPYLVKEGHPYRFVLHAFGEGGLDLGVLDSSETRWFLKDFEETPDESELGFITSNSFFTGRLAWDGSDDTPGLIALRRIKATWIREDISDEIMVGVLDSGRTEFIPTGEKIEIKYEFNTGYTGFAIETGEWNWIQNYDALVVLSGIEASSATAEGISAGHGLVTRNVWIRQNTEYGNKLPDSTPVFVVGDDSIFCTLQNGDDTDFIAAYETGGTFRIVTGQQGQVFESGRWVKKVNINAVSGSLAVQDFELEVWHEIGSKRIYSGLFSYTNNQVYFEDGVGDDIIVSGSGWEIVGHTYAPLLADRYLPYLHMHSDEYPYNKKGPVDFGVMLENSVIDEYKAVPRNIGDDIYNLGVRTTPPPITLSELISTYNRSKYFLRLTKSLTEDDVELKVYWTGMYPPGYPNYYVIQYWFFYVDSTLPSGPIFNIEYPYHEGDWEMCQITFEIVIWEEASTLAVPIALTASQHYYGQTIRYWEFEGGVEGVDYVKKTGNRPHLYIANGSHATYFKAGTFGVSSGDTRPDPESWTRHLMGDVCEESVPIDVPFGKLVELPAEARKWPGHWGKPDLSLFVAPTKKYVLDEKASGPRSPGFRHSGDVYLWATPHLFHNKFLRLPQDEDLKIE